MVLPEAALTRRPPPCNTAQPQLTRRNDPMAQRIDVKDLNIY
jgi:hypothetical protein